MRRALGAGLIIAALAMPSAADRRPGGSVTVVHEPRDEVPTIGPRHAPVTVEFFCSFAGQLDSKKAFDTLKELTERHPRRLRVEFHIVGNMFSEAAYEAFDQGVFSAFIEAAFSQRSRFRIEDIQTWARAADMNLDALAAALADGRHKPRIEAAEALRARRGGDRNDRLAFNGEIVPGALSSQPTIAEMEDHYDLHYRRAKDLLDQGVAIEDLFDRLVRDAEARREPPLGLPGRVDPAPGLEPPPVEPPQLAAAAPDTAELPSRGPSDARVVLTLACSLQSPLCRDMHRRLEHVRGIYPDDVRIVLAPLFDDEVHPEARKAFETALCAGDQGAFWTFVDKLFARFRPNQLDAEHLEAHAEAVDADVEQLRECVTARTHSATVDTAMQDLRKIGVHYAPSMLVGRRIYVGHRSSADLRALVAHALRPGLLERAHDLRRQILEALTPPGGEVDEPPNVPE